MNHDKNLHLLILGQVKCTFCKYHQPHYLTEWRQITQARKNLYRILPIYILIAQNFELDINIQDPERPDHFPHLTNARLGSSKWAPAIISNPALNFPCRLFKKKKNNNNIFFVNIEYLFHFFHFKCS